MPDISPPRPPGPPHPKRELLLELLKTSWAYLYVDGRVDGVDLPAWLHQPSVTLHVGYNMPVPILDLVVDDEGVSCTLSFRRTPHHCKLPWRSVFAIVDGDEKLMLFPDDVPPELREQLKKARTTPDAPSPEPTVVPPRAAPQRRPRTQAAHAFARSSDDSDDSGDPADDRAGDRAADQAAAATPPPDDVPRFKSGRPRPSHLKSV